MLPAQTFELGAGAVVAYHPGALGALEERAVRALREELALAPETLTIAGRAVQTPRLVAWHGDPEAGYAYSGRYHAPAAWTPTLRVLLGEVERVSALSFNACLVNLYRDGRDSMGLHRDDEAEVGPTPADRWIASLSFGAARRFVMKHAKTGERRSFDLGRGDVFVMRGTTQRDWVHGVPKTTRPVGERWNLTFRVIVPRGASSP